MDIMNVLRTGMNMSISRIPVWLCDTNQNLFWRMRRTNFSGNFRYKQITESRPEDQASRYLAKGEKRNCGIEDFVVPVDHRVKTKEKEKRDKYWYFTRDLRNL